MGNSRCQHRAHKAYPVKAELQIGWVRRRPSLSNYPPAICAVLDASVGMRTERSLPVLFVRTFGKPASLYLRRKARQAS